MQINMYFMFLKLDIKIQKMGFVTGSSYEKNKKKLLKIIFQLLQKKLAAN